ncbi:hypothetical protein [Fortiea sp. LEGE XX443]|nr:hypothetical protein [Fortiea sp. LEGE XX443]
MALSVKIKLLTVAANKRSLKLNRRLTSPFGHFGNIFLILDE